MTRFCVGTNVAIIATAMMATLSYAEASNAPLSSTDIESPSAAAIRKLPKESINTPTPKRFSLAEQREQELATARGLDEITVFGARDPEDVLKKLPPMLAFRARMDRERPMTPKEKTQLVLCLLGLCGANYGPDGAPVEDKLFSRSELAAKRSTLEMSQQFRGTFQ